MASTAAATDRAQGMAATDNALHETIGTPNCYWLDHRARRKGRGRYLVRLGYMTLAL